MFGVFESGAGVRERSGYGEGMLDLKLHIPVTDEVEVSSETLAAIDRGISDADEGRTVPISVALPASRVLACRFKH